MNANDKTISNYNKNYELYIEGTTHEIEGVMKSWIDKSLSYLSEGASILEIGIAFGRDARYMIQKGFLVTPTDASIKFVEYLKNESLDAQLLNLINDEIKDKYDMVFANAVLVHFTALQTKQSFKKIHDALKESGIFSFRIKEGMGSGWADHKVNSPRYFKYWKPDQIKKLLNDANFRLLDLIPQTTDDNKLWLQFITRKN